MRSPQQYIYSITPLTFSISYLKTFSLFYFNSTSLRLFPPCAVSSFSPSFNSFSFSFLLYKSREIAFFIESAFTFFSFFIKLSLASFCFIRFKLTPPLLLRFQQFRLVRVFLISSSSQSPSASSQSQTLPYPSSGEKPPYSSTSTSRNCCYEYVSFKFIFSSFTSNLSSLSSQCKISSFYCCYYSMIASFSFSLRSSLKHYSIQEFTNFYSYLCMFSSFGFTAYDVWFFSNAYSVKRLALVFTFETVAFAALL